VNYIGALLDLYTVAFETLVTKDFGLETELIFSGNGDEIGGGILLHGEYYFEPDFSIDRVYIGFWRRTIYCRNYLYSLWSNDVWLSFF
jgi:hypothetical protein